MLSNIAAFKNFMSFNLNDSSKDGLYMQLLQAADTAVKKYCKLNLESTTVTEFYSSGGTRDIVLRQRPVTSVASVYLDVAAYFGKAPNAFASTSLLTEGIDYAVIYDDDTGTVSNCACIRRIGISSINAFTWLANAGTLVGNMGGVLGPVWPYSTGGVKVIYTYGYTPDTVPYDLVEAVNELAAHVLRIRKFGGDLILSSETLSKYTYSLLAFNPQGPPAIGSIRQKLTRYRDIAA